MVPPPHTLTAGQFRALAAGHGDPAAIAVLAAAQLSKRRLLIRAVVDRVRYGGGPLAALAAAALALLAAVEAADPRATAEVLGGPHVDAWAAHCLRTLKGGDGAGGEFSEELATLAHLGALAAVAAIRAGVAFDLSLPSRDGEVIVPGLGLARDLGTGTIRVTGDGPVLTLAGPERTIRVGPPYAAERDHWLPVRTIGGAGAVPVLVVDDQNPYRDCYSWPPAPRLTAAQIAQLDAHWRAAWRLIARDHPRHAGAIRSVLRCLVPVLPPGPTETVSAASRCAFGAVATSLPPDPQALALSALHEFQHVKLGGLLDLVDLYRGGGTARYYAPWRADPRPVGPLLQGAYAHAAVTEFWCHRARAGGGRAAWLEFALWRRFTADAADELLRCGELTGYGRMFVVELREAVRDRLAGPVPAGVQRYADEVAAAAAILWRRRTGGGASPASPAPGGSVAAAARVAAAGGTRALAGRPDLVHAVLTEGIRR